jgi:diguanylate cyclase (GGDEF)-like protein
MNPTDKWSQRVMALDLAYKPIVNVYSGLIYGVEAKFGSIQGDGRHALDVLLHDADRAGQMAAVEPLLHRRAIEKFTDIDGWQGLKLLLTVDARAAIERGADLLFAEGSSGHFGVSPDALIVELRVHDQMTARMMTSALAQFSRRSCKLVINELSAAMPGLSLCYAFNPDIIQIDSQFVQDLDQIPRKRAFIASVISLARVLGVGVIAKGIADDATLRLIAELGCDLAIGPRIGKAEANPARVQTSYPHVAEIAATSKRMQELRSTILSQLDPMPVVKLHASLLDVLQLFGQHPNVSFFPVVDASGEPLGIVRERELKAFVYNAYGRDILRNKSVKRSLTSWVRHCPAVDVHARIDEIVRAYASDSGNEGIMVVRDRRFAGFLSSRALLGIVSENNIATARDQNPLTRLPGNQMIVDTTARAVLDSGTAYAIAYFDFDNFKPFNDAYGFRQGDRALLLFANLLSTRLPNQDVFVGHLGGDDFFACLKNHSADTARPIIEPLLSAFRKDIESFYGAEARQLGYLHAMDRQGAERRFPFMRVSCAILDLPIGRHTITVDALSIYLADVKKAAKISADGIAIAPWPSEPDDQLSIAI